MDSVISQKGWPKIPDDLRYAELRLPGTFRELVALRSLTNTQIGKIVRCLAMNTEFLATPDIEAVVEYYLRDLTKKRVARDKKREQRKRKKLISKFSGMPVGSGVETRVTEGATVTQDVETHDDSPSDLKEKISPPNVNIPSTKEKTPISLEKRMKLQMEGKDPDAIRKMIQEDLFSASSSCVDGAAVESVRLKSPKTEPTGRLRGVEPREGIDGSYHVVNGRVPDEAYPDSRVDSSWIPGRFAEFWRSYPRRVDKSFAYKTFVKIIKPQKNVERFMATLIASIRWWKEQESWKRDGGKYIPDPATWLNRGHWEDAMTNEEVRREAEFLLQDEESTEELIRRMNGEYGRGQG